VTLPPQTDQYRGPGGEPVLPIGAEPELGLGTDFAPEPVSQWKLFRRRFFRHRIAMVSLGLLILITFACFSVHWLSPFDPNKQDLLATPTGPNGTHWLGTDELGRDQLARILASGQLSLKIGFAVAVLSVAFGTMLGASAGFFGRWTDQALMRLTDLFLVVPELAILAVALQSWGQTGFVIILVLSALFWMSVARVVRGQVLALREKEFIEAARAAGASPLRIIVRHIIPNIIGPIMVNTTLAVTAAIITESTLSFLGFGVQPPQSSWGKMLSDAEGYVGTSKSYLIYGPGLAILLTVLCVNFIGDGLRDAFDPQSEKHS
jgi:peptide/nickel transport system permease protein